MHLTVTNADGSLGRSGGLICSEVTLTPEQLRSAAAGRLALVELSNGSNRSPEEIAVQFESTGSDRGVGRLWWRMPLGKTRERTFALHENVSAVASSMTAALDRASGQWVITEAGKPILRYNYQTNDPGKVLSRVAPANLKYARARSDYIHPLYGPDGEELTEDWSADHPHHRGIYWAWPEVDFQDQRGDLHALQRVFARPTGQCTAQNGPVFAQVIAENLWLWEDKEPIVRERTLIRAWQDDPDGRSIDLEFHFTALKEGVTVARRETKLYGGLNIRLAAVQEQRIEFHTDPPEARPRMAWAELSGTFPGGKRPLGVEVIQRQTNPDYPGDWVKYPEINWLQPTFPSAGTRYALKQDQALVLQFRLRIRWNTSAPTTTPADKWRNYQALPRYLTSPDL
jgi:hypothetical protein